MDSKTRIIKYLNGQLSEKDKQALEEELLNNPELLAEMDFQRFIAKNITERDEDHFRRKLSGVYMQYQKKKDRIRVRKRKLWISGFTVGVFLVILAGLFLFPLNDPTGEELFRKYYLPFDQNVTSRSTAEAMVEPELILGIDDYLKGNYQSSLAQLNSYIGDRENVDPYALFYRGLSSLELGHYTSACADLELFLEGDLYFLQDHAEWYLLLTYLVLDDQEKAKNLAGKMEGGRHFHSKELKDIKKYFNSNLR